ncbi:MAG: DUF3108 domain-containing protein [Rikenellaceae bacterium]|nr:DUF3108 domain-containing protein [Rikenellaceae bacterium]
MTKNTWAQKAFQAGEVLTYSVSYKVGLLEPDLATVTFKTTNSKVDGAPAYKINAVAEVDRKWKYFFDMRDDYSAWLDKETLRPLYYKGDIKEGSYRAKAEYIYDWDRMSVNTTFVNLKHNNPKSSDMPLSSRSFDGIAMFFNMRNEINFNMRPGFTAYLDVVMNNKIKRLQYKFIGFEERSLSDLGKYRTMKFSCQLSNSEDRNAFPDGSEFYVWFSDDDNRIPLYLETPIRVGSVKCYLSSYQGLKYPLGGKVQ